MKATTVTGFLIFCLAVSSIVGCGSSEPTATSDDELSQYLAAHPELVEAAKKADKEREQLEKTGE
jgi:hypothetical protein